MDHYKKIILDKLEDLAGEDRTRAEILKAWAGRRAHINKTRRDHNMKKFLKDFDFDNAKEIIKNNHALYIDLLEWAERDAMEQQEDRMRELFGADSGPDGLRWHSNYNSFYYTLEDAGAFIHGIDKSALYDEKQTGAYEKAKKLLDLYENMTSQEIEDHDEKAGHNLADDIDDAAKILLDLIEEDLHAYENLAYDENFLNDVLAIWLDARAGDLYMLDDDKSTLYEDMTKSYN